jgi:hypothetical protein
MSVETGWISPEHWQDPTLQGMLRKKGGKGHINKKWQERYFRLKNDSLFWFKDAKSDVLRGHVPLKGCTLEADTPKTHKHENCFRLYSKKLDKSYYLIAADYSEMLQWIQAIQDASTSVVSTANAVPAVTSKPRGYEEHGLLSNEDDDFPTSTSDRMESNTMTLMSRPLTLNTTGPNSERSTLVRDLDSVSSSE